MALMSYFSSRLSLIKQQADVSTYFWYSYALLYFSRQYELSFYPSGRRRFPHTFFESTICLLVQYYYQVVKSAKSSNTNTFDTLFSQRT